MTLCLRLLWQSVTLVEVVQVAAIDSAGSDGVATRRRYASRRNSRLLAMKTALLRDFESGANLDINCTPRRPHNTQIGRQVLTRNIDRMTITTDKGYVWADLRNELRAHDIRPVIKHREFENTGHKAGLTTRSTTNAPSLRAVLESPSYATRIG